MNPFTHAVAIVAGIAAPVGVTFWSASDSGPRSKAHYAAVEERVLTTREVIDGFEKMGIDERKPKEAILAYFSPDVIDHDPQVKGDRQSIIDYLDKRDWSSGVPQRTIRNIVVEGELGVVHHHIVRKPGEKGVAAVDIFRVRNGKVIEHWDVLQPVPENSVNERGMF